MMADEYIRRSDAIALMKKEAAELNEAFDELGGESGAYAEAYEDAANMLKEMPAADVAPVRHGEWFLLDDCANAGLYCSVCNRRVHREEFAYKKLRSKYCPHCGARMEGWNENE